MEAWPDGRDAATESTVSGRRPGVRGGGRSRRCSPRRCSSATPPATSPSTGPGRSPWRCSRWPRWPWRRAPPPAGTTAPSGSSTCSGRWSTSRGWPWARCTSWPGREVARRVLWGLVLFSGFAAGVLFSCPDGDGPRHRHPGGQGRLRCAAPHPRRRRQRGRRAVVIIGGAVVSAWRFLRESRAPRPRTARGRQRPHRAGHAGALERRAGPGRRRPRRGVRAQPRGRASRSSTAGSSWPADGRKHFW